MENSSVNEEIMAVKSLFRSKNVFRFLINLTFCFNLVDLKIYKVKLLS